MAADPTDTVHVQIVLDRSGSMNTIADATVDSINGFLAQQRKHSGFLRLSLADFDSQEPFRIVIDAIPIAEVLDLDRAQFDPRGGTPLFDAIGRAVERLDVRSVEQPDEDQVLVIVTDGYENASTDFSADVVSKLIDARQEEGWTVMFLGANQDSFATGESLSMRHGNVGDFDATDKGVRDAMSLASDAIHTHRTRDKQARRTYKDDLLDEHRRRRG